MATSATSRMPFSRAIRIIPASSAPEKEPGFKVRIETRTSFPASRWGRGSGAGVPRRFGHAGKAKRRREDDSAGGQVDLAKHALDERDQDLAVGTADDRHV